MTDTTTRPGETQPVELDDRGRVLWQRLADLNEQVAMATAEAEAVKAELREYLEAGTYGYQGRPVVRVTQARRFNHVRAAEALPPEVVDACRVISLDPARVRSQFADVEAAQFLEPCGKPRVALL